MNGLIFNQYTPFGMHLMYFSTNTLKGLWLCMTLDWTSFNKISCWYMWVFKTQTWLAPNRLLNGHYLFLLQDLYQSTLLQERASCLEAGGRGGVGWGSKDAEIFLKVDRDEHIFWGNNPTVILTTVLSGQINTRFWDSSQILIPSWVRLKITWPCPVTSMKITITAVCASSLLCSFTQIYSCLHACQTF